MSLPLFSLRMDDQIFKALSEFAEKEGITKSAVFRKFLVEGLERALDVKIQTTEIKERKHRQVVG